MQIFIHSFFRSSSTYFWSKFRGKKEYKCYYEPFHEIFEKIDTNIIHTASEKEWKSGHPQISAPYFLEFANILNSDGVGCRNYNINYAFREIYPSLEEFNLQKNWINTIIEDAKQDNKTPVFGFCRSFLRINTFISEYKNSCNIIQIKHPVNIFASAYSQNIENNNPYFCSLYSLIIKYNSNKVSEFKKYSEENNLPEVIFDYYVDMENYNIEAKKLFKSRLQRDFLMVLLLFFKITNFKKATVVNLDTYSKSFLYRLKTSFNLKKNNIDIDMSDLNPKDYTKDKIALNDYHRNIETLLELYFENNDAKIIRKNLKKYL